MAQDLTDDRVVAGLRSPSFRQRRVDEFHQVSITVPPDLDNADGAVRSALAVVLLAHAGHDTIDLVVGGRGPVTVARRRLHPDESIGNLAAGWEDLTMASEALPVAVTVGHRLDSLRLPALAGVNESEWIRHHPLAIQVEAGHLTVTARDDVLNHSELAVFADHLLDALHALRDDPERSVSELSVRLPALRFEVTLAGDGDLERVCAVIEHWAAEIGLPLSVAAAQLGELDLRPSRPVPGPSQQGAVVVVVDEGPRSAPVRRLAPIAAPPFPVGTGRTPDGALVAEVNHNETREVYDEIFTQRRYMRHGLEIGDCDCVVDVGANTGLFTLFAHHAATGVRIHAFEPVEELVRALRANVAMYGVDATIHDVALSSTPGHRPLIFYPRSTLQSGLYADADADAEVVRRYSWNLASMRSNNGGVDDYQIERLLTDRFRSVPRTVRTVPLSDVIDSHGIGAIDLLKIDVERAEHDVLAGIRANHWPIIAQAVIEVHDVEGRVEALRSLLKAHGFETIVDQDPLFVGTDQYMLFARRQDHARRVGDRSDLAVVAARGWASRTSRPVMVAAGPRLSAPLRDRLQKAVAEHAELRFIDLAVAVEAAEGPLGPLDHDVAVGTAITRLVTAPLRTAAKAIAVDADGVLWGGVVGEDGAKGLRVDGPFAAMRRELAAHRARGKLLMLTSKNSPVDIRTAFAYHRDLGLQFDDFASMRVSWDSKSSAIAEMADELGVGLDAIVFLDDNPVERAEVAARLPEVTVVDLSGDPSGYVYALRATWALDSEQETAEDRVRADFVRRDVQRRAIASGAASTAELLASLDVTLEIVDSTDADIERLAQLAARTNQFNTTLQRHSLGDLRRLLGDSTVALSGRVTDRVGSYGLVSFLAARAEHDTLNVTDLFISCRALGRNLEWAIASEAGRRARSAGLPRVSLGARRGDRNTPALAFLERVAYLCGGDWNSDRLVAQVDADRLAAVNWRSVEVDQRSDPASASPLTTIARAAWPVGPASAKGSTPPHQVGQDRVVRTGLFVKPRTVTELRIASVFGDVLGVDPIGALDDFVSNGGDSLAAVMACSRLQREYDLDVPLDAVLECQTVASLALRVSERGGERARTSDAPPSDRATPGQRRVWAASRSSTAGDQIIPLAWAVDGPLDVDRLAGALQQVVAGNDALHTGLTLLDGELVRAPIVATGEVRSMDLMEEDIDTVSARFFGEPFDLECGPMVRALIVREGVSRSRLLVAVSHVAADGWSIGLLQERLGAAYGDEPASTPGSYDQYARRVHRAEMAGAFGGALAPRHSAAVLHRRGRAAPVRRVRPAFRRRSVPSTALQDLSRLDRTLAAMPSVPYLAAFQLVLAVRSQRDVNSVGCVVANRWGADQDATIGFLANIVPVDLHTDWSATTTDHLQSTAAAWRAALGRADVPYGLVQLARTGDPYRFEDPPFEALYTYQTAPSHPLRLRGCTVHPIEPTVWPLPFSTMLDVDARSDGVSLLWRWDESQLNAESVEALADAYLIALRMLSMLSGEPLTFVRDTLASILDEVDDRQRRRAVDVRQERLDALQIGAEDD